MELSGNIIITQRVMYIHDIHEFRDALDTRWSRLLASCGLLPLIIPNAPTLVDTYLERFNVNGIILTGGNNLGETPQRDELEFMLIKHAIKNDIPLIGVCRGMQMLQYYCNAELTPVKGHSFKRHTIKYMDKEIEVNSSHNFGTSAECEQLETIAVAEDGIIEAVRYKGRDIYGFMWHPEREEPFAAHDKDFITDLFLSNK